FGPMERGQRPIDDVVLDKLIAWYKIDPNNVPELRREVTQSNGAIRMDPKYLDKLVPEKRAGEYLRGLRESYRMDPATGRLTPMTTTAPDISARFRNAQPYARLERGETPITPELFERIVQYYELDPDTKNQFQYYVDISNQTLAELKRTGRR